MGLSPRLRGNRHLEHRPISQEGSIPAPAGEPGASTRSRKSKRVYPRACGGTTIRLVLGIRLDGLSPRLRGNRLERKPGLQPGRSIPAPAGEPAAGPRGRSLIAVYPRACGGTRPKASCRSKSSGLSPRLRGNPHQDSVAGPLRGSIPAPAGEPGRSGTRHSPSGVYPRACGGTLLLGVPRTSVVGLSPRLRGNRSESGAGGGKNRSIPAPAGEPGG